MSDSERNAKLNGSSGFFSSYEESNGGGWSSENSLDYDTQNKRNKRRLKKRNQSSAFDRLCENLFRTERNQSSAYDRLCEDLFRTEAAVSNRIPLARGEGDGAATNSRMSPWLPSAASTPPNNLVYPGTQRPFSDEAVRTHSYYEQFGDYWNVFPKTDYVYSRHSRWYGTEVAPGIPRLPNMCRPTYRGRYDTPLSSHRLHNTDYSGFEETTLYARTKRIIRTSITTTTTTFFKIVKTATSPAVTAASSVASAVPPIASAASSAVSAVTSVASAAWFAATKVSTAVATVLSWVLNVFSSTISATFAARNSDEEASSSWKLWLLPFLLLLLVPVLYFAFDERGPPPPLVTSIFNDLSKDSAYSTMKTLSSPFDKLWGGAVCFGSLLVNSIMMIPTLFIETYTGFFQYFSTNTFEQSSLPIPPSHSTVGSSVTPEELNNLKLWASEMVAKKIRELKEELAAGHEQPDSQKDVLDALVNNVKLWTSELVAMKIGELKEELAANHEQPHSQKDILDTLMNNVKQWAPELVAMKIKELKEELAANHEQQANSQKEILDALLLEQNRIGKLEETDEEVLLRMSQLETSSSENEMKLQNMLKKYELAQIEKKKQRDASIGTTVISAEMRDDVMSIVARLLEEYHADRTGKPDYALGSNGAAIASIRCTRPFNKRPGEYVLWGILHWDHINTPDIIIKPGIMPGECWAFEGANGYVAIQLSMPIYVSSFSLEHTPKALTPFGHIESAPRKFSVWGLSSLEDKEEEFLGRFEFEDNGKSLQTFDAVEVGKPFQLVELRIESNHGHLEYTCLYRFRVHGRPAI